ARVGDGEVVERRRVDRERAGGAGLAAGGLGGGDGGAGGCLGERDRLRGEHAGAEGGAGVAARRAGAVGAQVDGAAEAGDGVVLEVLGAPLDVDAGACLLGALPTAARVRDGEVVERRRADRKPAGGPRLAAGVVGGGDRGAGS